MRLNRRVIVESPRDCLVVWNPMRELYFNETVKRRLCTNSAIHFITSEIRHLRHLNSLSFVFWCGHHPHSFPSSFLSHADNWMLLEVGLRQSIRLSIKEVKAMTSESAALLPWHFPKPYISGIQRSSLVTGSCSRNWMCHPTPTMSGSLSSNPSSQNLRTKLICQPMVPSSKITDAFGLSSGSEQRKALQQCWNIMWKKYVHKNTNCPYSYQEKK